MRRKAASFLLNAGGFTCGGGEEGKEMAERDKSCVFGEGGVERDGGEESQASRQEGDGKR